MKKDVEITLWESIQPTLGKCITRQHIIYKLQNKCFYIQHSSATKRFLIKILFGFWQMTSSAETYEMFLFLSSSCLLLMGLWLVKRKTFTEMPTLFVYTSYINQTCIKQGNKKCMLKNTCMWSAEITGTRLIAFW